HNAQNQITGLMQTGLVTPGYDANGNTTSDEFGDGFVFDAWNRLVRVSARGPGHQYSYDALGRRITRQMPGGATVAPGTGEEPPGPVTDLYYSSNWQVVEEQVSGAMTAQYVWSPVYVDAMIERDTAGGPRLYVQQDAHGNVTALVNTSGAVPERYAYGPDGRATVLTRMWQVQGSQPHGTSQYGWVYLHQGGRYERYSDAAGLYLFRNRDYSPTLGRWVEQDPAGYAGSGTNLYQAVGS